MKIFKLLFLFSFICLKLNLYSDETFLQKDKKIIESYIEKYFSSNDIVFLKDQIETNFKKKPYVGLRFAHNLPMDPITAIKIAALHIGGAKVVVFIPKYGNPKTAQDGIELIKKLNMDLREDHYVYPNEMFDIGLDCCAELLNLINPKFGFIELTKSGEIIYKKEQKKLKVPVISVNDSKIKSIETYFGTSDGCIRALEKFVEKPFLDKKYLLFGYGNVGSGIAKKLKDKNIFVTVVDVDENVLLKAKRDSLKVVLFENLKSLKEEIFKADVIVTTTGEENIISKRFDAKDKQLFLGKILINMGSLDEFGENFSKEDILNNKVCFNFALDRPTQYKYLDPVFYVHNEAVNVLLNNKLKPGVYPLEKKIDEYIFQKWLLLNNLK
jgi:adenosylhomocysteinase